jgi:hypothetical protein
MDSPSTPIHISFNHIHKIGECQSLTYTKLHYYNRALRKAYGIGICSVEEIGSFAESAPSSRDSRKLPP